MKKKTKKRRILIWLLLFVVLLFLAVFYIVPAIVVRNITYYKPYTFSSVLDYDSMRTDYGIYGNDNPSDYGFTTMEDIHFTSYYDHAKLDGWYMPALAPSEKCIIFVHGRTSNRLKAMKYLALIDSLNLQEQYNIFIPDLRNSGKSQPAKTYMGYKFAEDLLGAIHTLNKNKNQKHFVLYGFSMGGMAIQELMGDPRFSKDLKKEQISIDRLILDSPLSNVKETLWINSKEVGLPHFMFDIAWKKFNRSVNDNGENMRLSTLLKNVSIPILILQSYDDRTTPVFVLQTELEILGPKSNLTVVYFSGTRHVRTFQNPEKMHKYIRAVAVFFQKDK